MTTGPGVPLAIWIPGQKREVGRHVTRQESGVVSVQLLAPLTLLWPVSLQYMEKEEAMNVLQFWLAGDNFQNQLAAKKGQYDGQEAQNDAMILYDK